MPISIQRQNSRKLITITLTMPYTPKELKRAERQKFNCENEGYALVCTRTTPAGDVSLQYERV